jgi:hypothetical protein
MDTVEVEPRQGIYRPKDVVPNAPAEVTPLSDCRLVDKDGDTLAVHSLLGPYAPAALAPLRPWLKHFKGWLGISKSLSSAGRLSGINNANVTFGTTPPVPLRRRYGASPSSFDQKYPSAAIALDSLAVACAQYFKENLPDRWEEHNALEGIAGTDKGWMFGQGAAPWTSGIINNSAALPYHYDSGNVPGSWSAMVVLRERMDGGHLHMPDVNSWLTCEDLSITIFNGREHLHGVTPLLPQDSRSYRFSIVFYAKSGIVRSLAPGEEIKQAQERATASTDLAQWVKDGKDGKDE